MKRRFAWVICVAIAAIATGLALSWRPWWDFREHEVKRQQAVAEKRAAQAERSELLGQKARIETPVGKEELARSRGYVRPGEVPLEVAP